MTFWQWFTLVSSSIDLSSITLRYGNNRPKLELANGPEDWGSIPGQVIPKIQKMVLDAVLINTQHYKGKDQG